MIAAIYARKSTDQNVADEEKANPRKPCPDLQTGGGARYHGTEGCITPTPRPPMPRETSDAARRESKRLSVRPQGPRLVRPAEAL